MQKRKLLLTPILRRNLGLLAVALFVAASLRWPPDAAWFLIVVFLILSFLIH